MMYADDDDAQATAVILRNAIAHMWKLFGSPKTKELAMQEFVELREAATDLSDMLHDMAVEIDRAEKGAG